MEERWQEILHFWYPGTADTPMGRYDSNPAAIKMWFAGSTAVDDEIRRMFSKDLEDARAGKLDDWKSTPEKTLAGLIIMDQFTRNMCRNTPQMFDMDEKARSWAKYLVDNKMTDDFPRFMLLSVYLPYMHSEELADQERCVELFEALGAEVAAQPNQEETKALKEFVLTATRFAIAHRDIIAKWGRFPHRNEALGRKSLDAEIAGLRDGSIARF